MSKKKKSQAQKSKGRHNENRTIRWRERRILERIDRSGDPVPSNPKALAKAMIESGAIKPPGYYDRPPEPDIPDNVLDFTQAKTQKDNRPKNQTGNEAKPLVTAGASEQSLVAKHNSAVLRTIIEQEKYLYKKWSEEAKQGKTALAKMGSCYAETLLLEQRELSKAGHKRLKFKSPPSIVHNPGLLTEPRHGGYATGKSKPISEHNKATREKLDPKFYMPPKPGSTVAPSGLPISAFLAGGRYEPKTTVVYPTEPTKDWGNSYAEHMRNGTVDQYWQQRAANDPDAKQYLAKRLTSYVQWFINHVEPQNWETKVHNLVTWRDGDLFPNTGAINKAAARMEDELNIHKAMNDSHEREWKMLDGALADAHSENNLLRQELQATQVELRNLEFLYSHSVGNHEDAKVIAQELLGNYVDVSKSKTPPEDADTMLKEYKLYDSFVRVDGPEFAFARYVYGDPRMGQVIRDHADHKTDHRLMLFDEREALRRINRNVRTAYTDTYVKYPEIKRFREKAALYRIKHKVQYGLHWEARHSNSLRANSRLYYSRLKYKRLEHDSVLFKRWGNKATPFNRKKPVNYQQVINDVVGVRSICYSPPHLVDYYGKLGIKHQKYMNKKMAKFYLQQTTIGKITKSVGRVMDVLNTEVNPIARHKMKQEKEEQRLRKQEAKVRKAERKKAKQEKAERDHIRKMQRIVH